MGIIPWMDQIIHARTVNTHHTHMLTLKNLIVLYKAIIKDVYEMTIRLSFSTAKCDSSVHHSSRQSAAAGNIKTEFNTPATAFRAAILKSIFFLAVCTRCLQRTRPRLDDALRRHDA